MSPLRGSLMGTNVFYRDVTPTGLKKKQVKYSGYKLAQ